MTRSRRGMTLLEIMVVIAIMLALLAIVSYGARSLLDVDKRAAAKKLSAVYERFHDEAIMRNRTYRITYFLDEGRYVIESGEPGALVAASPEDRERYEAEVKKKLEYLDEEEKAKFLHRSRQPFSALEEAGKMEVELPAGVRFGGVYTPQYGKMIRPGDKLEGMEADDDDEAERLKVFSYVMNNGFSEHTIVWIVDANDPTDGYTVEVEPLSGVARLTGDLVDPLDGYGWIPESGPSLPQ